MTLLPTLLYTLLGVYFWHVRLKDEAMAHPGVRIGERIAIALAITVHGGVLYTQIFQNHSMHFGFSYALSMMLWLAVLVYWIESLYVRWVGLQVLTLPLAAFCALLPIAFPGRHTLAEAGSVEFQAHFLVAMFAYSLFTLAALHAIVMAVVERQLHQGKFAKGFGALPPLLKMETILFRLIFFAWVLLTLALISGIAFSETLFGKPFTLTHKTLFSFISWGLFLALLIGRHIYGWRGRLAIRWTLFGFVMLLLAYVGSRFVLEVILGR